MNQDFMKQFEKTADDMMDAARQFNAFGMRAMERVTAAQLAATNEVLESSLKQVSLASQAKDLPSFMNAQQSVVSDLQGKFSESARSGFELSKELGEEFTSLMTASGQTLSAKAPVAAKKKA